MTMPAYIVGSASLLAVAYLIQKKRLKSWVVSITAESLACACYIALVVVRSSLVKYLLVAFAAMLSFVLIPGLWSERIRASHGSTSAGLAIGVTSAASGLHGILGPQLYQSSFGPTYMASFSVAAGLACLANVCIVIMWAILSKGSGGQLRLRLDRIFSRLLLWKSLEMDLMDARMGSNPSAL